MNARGIDTHRGEERDEGLPSVAAPSWPARLWGFWLPEERLLVAIGALTLLILQSHGASFQLERVIAGYTTMFGYNLCLLITATRLRQVWRKRRDASIGNVTLAQDLTLLRVTAFLFGYTCIYSNIKARIPIFNQNVHDSELRSFEESLFGIDLVSAAREIQHWPLLNRLLDLIYHHDYIFLTLSVFILLDRELHAVRRLMVAMGLLYISGVLLTAAWPTLGPAFVERDAYTWMREQGIDSWNNQSWLWKHYSAAAEAAGAGESTGASAFIGIAALPSLHVGHCLLLCRAAWAHHRWLLPLYIPVTLLTWLATLAFGWHYLSDGLVAIPLVLLCWWAAGWVVGARGAQGSNSLATVTD